MTLVETRPDTNALDLRQLAQISRQSPMGKLLRKFWHPIALSRDIEVGKAKPVRALGEDFALYRGESGKAFLVSNRCAHRLTFMHTGWIEGDTIRCIYHGWRYDGSGQCVERPAEPGSSTASIRIPGYPVEEYAGLIFAYLGDGPAPPFEQPRKHVLEDKSRHLYTRFETWNCNWFQMIENSLDATHVSFVHQMGHPSPFGTAVSTVVPELSYLENEAGLEQVAVRSPTNVRVSDWTFPNNNHIVLPVFSPDEVWLDLVAWMVPIDETHSTRFFVYSVPDEIVRRHDFDAYFTKYGDYNPADFDHELMFEGKYPQEPLFQLTGAQDYVATVGQGTIVQSEFERLGKSDLGITRVRRLFLRELNAIKANKPTKVWGRRPVRPVMRRKSNGEPLEGTGESSYAQQSC